MVFKHRQRLLKEFERTLGVRGVPALILEQSSDRLLIYDDLALHPQYRNLALEPPGCFLRAHEIAGRGQ